jgi:hypothetical protein
VKARGSCWKACWAALGIALGSSLLVEEFPFSYIFSAPFWTEQHERVTLRQTQVLVIPANEDIMEFTVFDDIVTAINQARRNARDYVTDVSLERLDENMYGEGDRDWW